MGVGMSPFFSYYGAKWRGYKYYPPPQHDTLIEPFAGAAGYATRYYTRNVVLCERSAIIVGIWRYLINATPQEIRALPILELGDSLDNHDIPQEAKWLIGLTMNKACAKPVKTPRPPAWNAWTPQRRNLIAHQVTLIRHWRIVEGSYECISDRVATWFIDPPYSDPDQGGHYQHGCEGIDYEHLAEYARTRTGQVLVCEGMGASWLPFRFLVSAQSTGNGRHGRTRKDPSSRRTFDEVVWTNQWEDVPWIEHTTP